MKFYLKIVETYVTNTAETLAGRTPREQMCYQGSKSNKYIMRAILFKVKSIKKNYKWRCDNVTCFVTYVIPYFTS